MIRPFNSLNEFQNSNPYGKTDMGQRNVMDDTLLTNKLIAQYILFSLIGSSCKNKREREPIDIARSFAHTGHGCRSRK